MRYLVLIPLLVLSLYGRNFGGRNFGGLSENKVESLKPATYAPAAVVTEEIFKAKDTQEMKVAMDEQKKVQGKDGLLADEFAKDETGHLFGGISEGKLSF